MIANLSDAMAEIGRLAAENEALHKEVADLRAGQQNDDRDYRELRAKVERLEAVRKAASQGYRIALTGGGHRDWRLEAALDAAKGDA